MAYVIHQSEETQMRVIITGGTGLIGRNLAPELASAGHEVIILSRNPEKTGNLPPGVRAERWDARTAAGWGRLVDGTGAIVNLAGENIGEGRWSTERKLRILQSRLDAGRAVVEAVNVATHKPAVLIQASAVGYYGPHADEEVTESTPPGNDYLADVAIKWEASTAPVEAMGVRRAVIRTGVALSREGGVLPRMLLPFRLFAGGPYGNGQQWFPWIHMDDDVRAISFLIENETAQGPYNLSAPNPSTSRDFARVLGRVMGRPARLPVPALAIRILFDEMATLLLDGQREIPRRLLETGFEFQYTQAEAALRDLLQ
jgi:uncharacterized protein